jgi:AcrR family transcriptional regulator
MTDTALRIQLEAHSLFMQYGLKSVSMDDIAAKIGISKKTIYQFYSDKEQLVIQVITAIINKNQETCEIDRKRAIDAVHEIFLAMQQMSELFHHMNPSILFDMHKYYPEAYKVFLKYKNGYLYNIIKENINRGIKEELYREDINLEIMTRYRLESIIIPFQPEFQQHVKSNLVEIAEQISTHFLFGMVSPKGYKITQKYIQQKIKK